MADTVTITEISGTTDLHQHYDRQTSAQPCYIELDCRSAQLSASYNAEIGNARPMSVYHGHHQRWQIPCLTASAANDLLRELLPMAQRIVDGYDSRWDGNNNVARFADDAECAIEDIDAICSSYEADESTGVQEYDAGDYLSAVHTRYDGNGAVKNWFPSVRRAVIDGHEITGKTTDAELADIETAIEAGIPEGTVVNNLSQYLEEERNQCRENMARDAEDEEV